MTIHAHAHIKYPKNHTHTIQCLDARVFKIFIERDLNLSMDNTQIPVQIDHPYFGSYVGTIVKVYEILQQLDGGKTYFDLCERDCLDQFVKPISTREMIM